MVMLAGIWSQSRRFRLMSPNIPGMNVHGWVSLLTHQILPITAFGCFVAKHNSMPTEAQRQKAEIIAAEMAKLPGIGIGHRG